MSIENNSCKVCGGNHPTGACTEGDGLGAVSDNATIEYEERVDQKTMQSKGFRHGGKFYKFDDGESLVFYRNPKTKKLDKPPFVRTGDGEVPVNEWIRKNNPDRVNYKTRAYRSGFLNLYFTNFIT